MIRLVHNIHKPNVSDKKWEKHLARKAAKREKRLARLEKKRAKMSRAELEQRLREAEEWKEVEIEPGPSAPPPAARSETPPPQPSLNAEWVSGYWHWGSEKWLWVGGQWRVPETDVRGGLTVRAPYAPPPLRNELRTARPAVGMVWVTGYWQWSGTTYIWVSGSWRIAPKPGSRWRPPRWRTLGSGVVFMPGGWGIEVGQ